MLPVTIVTPVFNGARFIDETLTSLLAQRYEALSVIVVDDGSTDATPEILARYSARLRIIRQTNSGESAAVNRGVGASTSDWVCVVNADDMIDRDWIATAMAQVAADPNLVCVYPDYRIIDAEGRRLRVVRALDYDYAVMLEQHYCFIGPGAVFRCSVFGLEGVRSSRFPLNGDFDSWLRLGLRGSMKHVPEIMASWREHGDGTSSATRNAAMAAARIALIETFYARPGLPQKIFDMRARALSSAYYCAAILTLRDAAVPGRRYALRSLLFKPRWPRHYLPERRRSLKLMIYLLGLPLTRPLKSWFCTWMRLRGKDNSLDWR